jgi:hypothetical protein
MGYLVLVIVASLALLAGGTSLKFFGAHHFAPQQSGIQGVAANSPVEILFIGSSHTRQSYDPRELERMTGARVYLVAYTGLDYVSMLPALRHLFFEKNQRPRICVVEAYVSAFGREHAVRDTRLFFEADPSLKWRLLEEFRRPPRTLEKFSDAFALVVNRNNDSILMYPLNRALLSDISYRGASDKKFLPGVKESEFRKLLLPELPAEPDPQQLQALHEIVRAGREAGIRMVFVESPLPAPVAAQEGIRALKAGFRRTLESMHVEYYDGDLDFPLEDPSLFSDSNHVSTKGRRLFTQKVADWLQRQTP